MNSLLPPECEISGKFREIHARPLSFWKPALEALRQQHGLPQGAWSRFASGRNAVFELGSEWVFKLMAPRWYGDGVREEAALATVRGKLPVETPEPVASGELDRWRYLVTRRLPGTLLGEVWTQLSALERRIAARQIGAVARALHGLEVPGPNSPMRCDWEAMLRDQKAYCHDEMKSSGASASLLADLDPFLDSEEPIFSPEQPHVLLHGDLNPVNWLFIPGEDPLRLTALIDFGDARIGPIAHDFISPAMHRFRGEAQVLEAFYSGYGLERADLSALQDNLMARTLLYYSSGIVKCLEEVPVTGPRSTWRQVAAQYWQLA